MDWLIKLTKDIPYGIFVEIGTDRGASADAILSNNPTCFLYCIDPYESYIDYEDQINQVTGDDLYYSVYRTLIDKFGDRVKIIRKFSDNAIDDIPNNIDFLYIDGNHRCDYVYNDIKWYYPKLKMHGIMLLDDAVDKGRGDERILWSPNCYGTYGVVTAFFKYFGKQRVHAQHKDNQIKVIKCR